MICFAGSVLIYLYVDNTESNDFTPQVVSNYSTTEVYATHFTLEPQRNMMMFRLKVAQTNFSNLKGWANRSQPDICSEVKPFGLVSKVVNVQI